MSGGGPPSFGISSDLAATGAAEAKVLLVYGEDVSVSKRVLKTLVRATPTTSARHTVVEEDLHHDHVVVVERVPIGLVVDAVPPVRQQGDVTILSVVDEVVVVERRLVLKEEVQMRRVRDRDNPLTGAAADKRVAEILRAMVRRSTFVPPARDDDVDPRNQAIIAAERAVSGRGSLSRQERAAIIGRVAKTDDLLLEGERSKKGAAKRVVAVLRKKGLHDATPSALSNWRFKMRKTDSVAGEVTYAHVHEPFPPYLAGLDAGARASALLRELEDPGKAPPLANEMTKSSRASSVGWPGAFKDKRGFLPALAGSR